MHRGSSVADEITVCELPSDVDLFAELSASVRMEDLGKGRRGGVLTRPDETGAVPLVRTTTRYTAPPQPFREVHERLARRIRECAGLPVGFNNALIECYTNAYRRMGAHSDQALDLEPESFIAVFSCYEHPEGPARKLVFESKSSDVDGHEVALAHHGAVVFSVAANRRLRHKIVLDAPVGAAGNRWLGVTFRMSKTLLRFRDGHAYLPGGSRLSVADDEAGREFYRLRRRENEETDFAYPAVDYTVSGSDLSPPVVIPGV
ncbi:alpha-ketoglutarate-dependent dioxygenase AlkB [Phytomonospora endophytica]|uniref:Alpha-ketoglutarate-dependent dioxygenase AlkB-like domain-containing protein n=1 Tax=Phytomonospora endophytica TaxID=714109 RepID=A0A841F8G3_9ACTN|nr:alpha-ketoglutarate-dependent dioxygenase AlkB [Phytomonospora endophytica]MBB6033371.1 hypothetical protein [Phytomonospora endophytica]GIG70858.1 hypothetical protein Pen01_71530 [Phytomonospora endophytica]